MKKRVFLLLFLALCREEAVKIAPQALEGAARTGFTAVEWGGAEVNEK